ncbi:MAG: hypothetical protein ACK4HE_12150, partial [Chitinophagaceae bacterium]
MKRSFLLTMLAAGTLSAIAQQPTKPTPSTPRPGTPAGTTVQSPAGTSGGAGMMNSKPGPKA